MHPRLRLLKFELDVMERLGFKNQAAETLLRLEAGGTGTTALDGCLPEMMVSLIKHQGGKINNVHDGNSALLHICQKCDATAETVNSVIPEVAAIAQATTKRMETEENPMLDASLQAQGSDPSC